MFLQAQVVRGAVAILSLGLALAQTPPEYAPGSSNTISVAFGNVNVSNGTYVLLGETAASPTISLANTQRNSSHVLAMIDLNAPGGFGNGNNTYSPLLHWMTFLPANLSLLTGNETSTNDIAPYMGPQPSVGTGMHHYVLLLYSSTETAFQMPVQFQSFNASNLEDRLVFNISGFAADAGLELSAANWFQTQNVTAAATPATSEGTKSGLGFRVLASAALLGLVCAAL